MLDMELKKLDYINNGVEELLKNSFYKEIQNNILKFQFHQCAIENKMYLNRKKGF